MNCKKLKTDSTQRESLDQHIIRLQCGIIIRLLAWFCFPKDSPSADKLLTNWELKLQLSCVQSARRPRSYFLFLYECQAGDKRLPVTRCSAEKPQDMGRLTRTATFISLWHPAEDRKVWLILHSQTLTNTGKVPPPGSLQACVSTLSDSMWLWMDLESCDQLLVIVRALDRLSCGYTR